jgi:uncharacterized protein (TIGR02266 family)
MRRVILEVDSPEDVLHRVFPNGKMGGLTIDGPTPGMLGDALEIEVKVKQPRRSFVIKGQLAWVRHKGQRALKECFGVDFAEGDAPSTDRLLAFARNELGGDALRVEQRQVTNLPVTLSHQNKTRKEFLADLSPGGAFVRSADPLLPGESVTLTLRAPLAVSLLPIKLKGRVAWVRRTGTATGMGIEFVVEDMAAQQRLLRLLARIGNR